MHVLIIAYSSRALAQMAAREGFLVSTLDAFADADTQAIAQATYLLKVQNGQLDAVAFKSQIESLDISRFDAVLYGSIFDSTPGCLEWLAGRVVIAGNSANVLHEVQDKPAFFSALQRLGIPFPKTVFSLDGLNPDGDWNEDWLVKRFSSCGGAHIRRWHGEPLSAEAYLQRHIEGLPVSLLFYANGEHAYKIGFNRQLVDALDESPYRYAGVVSQLDLPHHAAEALLHAAEKLAAHFHLQGINSLDAVLTEGGVYVLELNPRISASAHLYPDWPLIRMQLGLQADDFLSGDLEFAQTANGEAIIYASKEVVIKEDFKFSDWAADIPVAGHTIAKHNPVCTVQACADTHEAALELLMQRRNQLKNCLEL